MEQNDKDYHYGTSSLTQVPGLVFESSGLHLVCWVVFKKLKVMGSWR